MKWQRQPRLGAARACAGHFCQLSSQKRQARKEIGSNRRAQIQLLLAPPAAADAAASCLQTQSSQVGGRGRPPKARHSSAGVARARSRKRQRAVKRELICARPAKSASQVGRRRSRGRRRNYIQFSRASPPRANCPRTRLWLERALLLPFLGLCARAGRESILEKIGSLALSPKARANCLRSAREIVSSEPRLRSEANGRAKKIANFESLFGWPLGQPSD